MLKNSPKNADRTIHNITIGIPTIGRVDMLSSCLKSIANGDSLPKEILLADQSGGSQVKSLASEFTELPLRVVTCSGEGIARNMNLIMRLATFDHVAITHDDCNVSRDWLDACVRAMQERPEAMITGRVLAAGDDPLAVPSTKDSLIPVDFSGTVAHGMLYPANMLVCRQDALNLGGFDERRGFYTAAEDLDFSYRWLKSGNSFIYDPKMIVIHNDWRTPEHLVQLYKHYARCAGRFYGKHLASGDIVPMKQGFKDVYSGVQAWRVWLKNRTPRWQDERLELPVWVPIGVVEGLWESLVLAVSSSHDD